MYFIAILQAHVCTIKEQYNYMVAIYSHFFLQFYSLCDFNY